MAPTSKTKPAKKKAVEAVTKPSIADSPSVLKQELMEDLKQLFMKGDLPEAKPAGTPAQPITQ